MRLFNNENKKSYFVDIPGKITDYSQVDVDYKKIIQEIKDLVKPLDGLPSNEFYDKYIIWDDKTEESHFLSEEINGLLDELDSGARGKIISWGFHGFLQELIEFQDENDMQLCVDIILDILNRMEETVEKYGIFRQDIFQIKLLLDYLDETYD